MDNSFTSDYQYPKLNFMELVVQLDKPILTFDVNADLIKLYYESKYDMVAIEKLNNK